MKNFQIVLEKMGCHADHSTLEPDDLAFMWTKEMKFGGIMKAFKWVKSHHPKLKLDPKQIDKLNPYEYRCYVDTSCGHYQNIVGLWSEAVGMVYVMIREFRYSDNDEQYGDKLFFYDDQWQ